MRSSTISLVLVAILAVIAVPASAATGGLAGPIHKPHCKHGKHHKCRRHIPPCIVYKNGKKVLPKRPCYPVVPPCLLNGQIHPGKCIGGGPCIEKLGEEKCGVAPPCYEYMPVMENGQQSTNWQCKSVREPPKCPDCNIPPCYFVPDGVCGMPESEPLEAKNLEVYEAVGFKGNPSSIWASAEVFNPLSDEITIAFVAKYGSFDPTVYSGPKSEPHEVLDRYIPPCQEKMPPDGRDVAWVVVFDRTSNSYIESEHLSFNILEPENVHYPVITY